MFDVIIFKYWKQLVIVLMVGLVSTYVGVSVYSLNVALSRSQSPAAKAVVATLTEMPQNKNTQIAYKKSATVFEKIQELKEKKQDTSELEKMYASTLKNLSDQKYSEAEKQLQELNSHIAKIDTALVASVSAQPSGDPGVSPAVTPDIEDEASGTASAERN